MSNYFLRQSAVHDSYSVPDPGAVQGLLSSRYVLVSMWRALGDVVSGGGVRIDNDVWWQLE